MIMDVTDRKQGEEAIRLNESRYRSLVIASATIVWTASPKGAGLTGAHSWAEYTGQPPHESAGWGWVDAVHPDDRDAARDAWAHALSSTTPLNTVYRVRRRDGEYRYVAATGVPVLADDGSVREWVGMVRDVHAEHALRESEQEARRLREELHRVSAVAMLSTMVASIAHDVAQPLTAIDANAKTLLRYALRSSAFGDFREALRDIVSDTARARELLERPRRHLRTGTVKKRPLSMNATVTDVVRVLRRSADDAGIRVVTHLAPSLPLFMGDSLEVQQVLVNILMNAFESEALVPDARRTVTVRTWAFDGQVAVSVADNGEGVTDEQLEHMFEPLYTSKPHGMGLGLAICKVIVEEHGGTIAATRNETDGITLAVAVPAAPPPVEGSPARA
jgi:PAS domain S-box-containing protein